MAIRRTAKALGMAPGAFIVVNVEETTL